MQLSSKNIKLSLNEELKNIINKEEQYTVPIFIPHKGCKHCCVFCNQKRISGTIKVPSPSDVKSIIDERLSQFKGKKRIQIAFFGGSFTGLDIVDQIRYLKVASTYIKEGKVDSIRLSTRPDYINVKILKVLKRYGVKSIELGVQSLNDDVLNGAKRGHTKNDVIRASRLIRLFGFSLGHQIMIGLPQSTVKEEVSTIKESLNMGIKDLRIYPVYVIKDTELYEMYEQGIYKPLTLKEAVDRTYEVLKECRKTDVRVIRLGLQSTSEITSRSTEILGPVCDNFAEYALARIIRDTMEKSIDEKVDCINFEVPERYISIVVGPKRINKIYLEKKYNVKIRVIGEK